MDDAIYVRAEPFDFERPHPRVQAGEHCQMCCCGEKACEHCDGGIVHLEVDDEVALGDDDYAWVHTQRCQGCGWYQESCY
jgi:hypothetical protein